MEGLYQVYVDNLAAAREYVMKPHSKPGVDQEQALQEIRDHAEKLFHIHQENDRILKEILFSKTADTLTAKEAEDLSALADQLFNYNRSPDVGIAYRIHQLLYGYACYHEDTGLIVRELYYLGITLLYLNVRDTEQGVNLFVEQIGKHFQAGAAYLERYEEFEDSQTRGYILRCLGNTKYGIKNFQGDNSGRRQSIHTGWEEYQECFSRTMKIFHSPRYRQMNPELPWDTFIYTMHYDRTQFLTSLREIEDSDIAEAVLESAEYVYRHQEQIAKAKETSVGTRTQYVYKAARYHAGLIPVEELLETLFEICESADIQDFSGDNIWALLHTPEYLMHYVQDLSLEEQQKLSFRVQAAFDKQKRYLFLLPQNEYGNQVSRSVHVIAGFLSGQDTVFIHQLLDYILACHPPTFVHSKMVALLTQRICEQMIKVNPGWLSGTFGFEGIHEVKSHREELLELAYHSGLYHDLGKCMLLNYVGLYSRRLLDEEFACIKLHVTFGCRLLEAFRMEDMAKIAYYHHRTHDGAGGYPRCQEDSPAKVRCIADIVTVVDSLDAGTDNVGRSYAASKTYGQLVEELRAGKGGRYAAEVVELFDDPEFYEEIERFINESRIRVYLDIYFPER